MMDIDLSKYKLVSPESIEKVNGFRRVIDIEVDNDHTFFIKGENDLILSHNCDGNAISALLINFLYKYWPELFENPMVFKADTPIVVATNIKKKSNKISFYTQEEYNEWLQKISPKDWEIEYKKGLAALVDDEYRDIINNPRLIHIVTDETSKDSLNTWFGKESDLRKNQLLK